MAEFTDLFDDEGDVFQKKAKVCTAHQGPAASPPGVPHHLPPATIPISQIFDSLSPNSNELALSKISVKRLKSRDRNVSSLISKISMDARSVKRQNFSNLTT